jgi:hypothetical protein
MMLTRGLFHHPVTHLLLASPWSLNQLLPCAIFEIWSWRKILKSDMLSFPLRILEADLSHHCKDSPSRIHSLLLELERAPRVVISRSLDYVGLRRWGWGLASLTDKGVGNANQFIELLYQTCYSHPMLYSLYSILYNIYPYSFNFPFVKLILLEEASDSDVVTPNCEQDKKQEASYELCLSSLPSFFLLYHFLHFSVLISLFAIYCRSARFGSGRVYKSRTENHYWQVRYDMSRTILD